MNYSGKFLLLCAVLIMYSGCAYFNTFYLAQKNFNRAEKDRIENKGVVNSTARGMYNEAIKWSSGILENYKDSKYVDDSLYIIGMSFYYQGDYLKARIKFDELLLAFPESELAQTAIFFKAKSLIELEEEDEAMMLLLDLVDSDDPDINGPAGLAIAEISLKNENWEELLSASQKVIDRDPNDEDLITAIYYKSKSLFELERYEECSAELIDLSEYEMGPDQRFKVNSLLSLSEAEQGKYEVAMSYLETMQNRGEFNDYAPKIRLQIGKIYELQNDETMAMDTYRKLAGDFPDSLAAKEAWYNVGKILISDLSQAEEAKNAFDMVKKGSARTNESWYTEAGIKSVQIDTMMARIEQIDDIMQLMEDYKNDSEEPESVQPAVLVESPDSTVVAVTESALSDSAAGNGESRENSATGQQPTERRDYNFPEMIGRTRFSLAELYNYSFERPDAALEQYKLIMEQAPETEYAVKSDYFIRMYELQQRGEYSEQTENALMKEIAEEYPESEFAQELKVFLGLIDNPPEVKLFIEAEMAYMNGESPEVYIPMYQKVVEQYPNTKSAYRARFVIAYTYEHALGDIDRAQIVYERLADEEETTNSAEYVNLAEEKLRMIEEHDKLIESLNESIAYYEMRIEDIEKGTNRENGADTGVVTSGGTADAGYIGLQKIRARNARIRSRYYQN